MESLIAATLFVGTILVVTWLLKTFADGGGSQEEPGRPATSGVPTYTNDPPLKLNLDLNGPHRLFAVCAGLWAVVAPWFDAPDLRRWLSWNVTGPANAETATALFLAVVPPLGAYLAIFVVGPPVFRWVREGFDQERPG